LNSGFGNYIKNYIKKRFHIRSADEIRLTGEDFEGLYNPYYARLSDIFHAVGFASSALLVIFIITAVIFNFKSVTYENLYYFIKDFDAVVSSDKYATSSVVYSYEDNREYAPYKGGLVTAGSASVSVFSATGRKTATFYDGYDRPVIRASSKYFIVYSVNGNEFSVYNSFVRLYTEKLDYPIFSAEICDDGEFVILTSDSEYKSVIYRYTQNFKKSAAYYYNEYVISMSLSPDGKYLAVSLAGTENGTLSSRLNIYKEKSKEPQNLCGSIPGLVIKCGVKNEFSLTGKLFYYYISGSAIFLKGSADTPDEIRINDGESLLAVDSDGSGIIAAVSDSEGYLIYIIPYKGGTASIRLDEKPLQIKKRGDIIYVLYKDTVVRYDVLSGTYEKKACAAGAENIIVSSENYIFVCYASRAVSIGY
jgi:WD40 repeat protein